MKPLGRTGTGAIGGRHRRVEGVFAGLHTGAVKWLAEAHPIHDESFPGDCMLAAGLLEGDWRIKQGHNLKLTAQYYDLDTSVSEEQQARCTSFMSTRKIPFLHIRTGYRSYHGIPQSDPEDQRNTFVELTAYL